MDRATRSFAITFLPTPVAEATPPAVVVSDAARADGRMYALHLLVAGGRAVSGVWEEVGPLTPLSRSEAIEGAVRSGQTLVDALEDDGFRLSWLGSSRTRQIPPDLLDALAAERDEAVAGSRCDAFAASARGPLYYERVSACLPDRIDSALTSGGLPRLPVPDDDRAAAGRDRAGVAGASRRGHPATNWCRTPSSSTVTRQPEMRPVW